MSGYQHKEGMGSMLANNKAADNHPDWRGDFMLNGTLYEVAGWQGSTQGGKPRISLKVQPQRERQPAPTRIEGRRDENHPRRDDEDLIPF